MTTPAGWYPDPEHPSTQRWWDGTQWTDHRQGGAPEPAPAPYEPPAASYPPGGFGGHPGAAQPGFGGHPGAARPGGYDTYGGANQQPGFDPGAGIPHFPSSGGYNPNAATRGNAQRTQAVGADIKAIAVQSLDAVRACWARVLGILALTAGAMSAVSLAAVLMMAATGASIVVSGLNPAGSEPSEASKPLGAALLLMFAIACVMVIFATMSGTYASIAVLGAHRSGYKMDIAAAFRVGIRVAAALVVVVLPVGLAFVALAFVAVKLGVLGILLLIVAAIAAYFALVCFGFALIVHAANQQRS
jgi:hypothetical protein